MAQQNLFADPALAERDAAEAALFRELRRIGRERCTGWVTVYIEAVAVYKGHITAKVWLNGRPVCVLDRSDVECAARDLWDQVAPQETR